MLSNFTETMKDERKKENKKAHSDTTAYQKASFDSAVYPSALGGPQAFTQNPATYKAFDRHIQKYVLSQNLKSQHYTPSSAQGKK